MRIDVSGKHIDVGDALREHVQTKLAEAVGKYSGRPVDGAVTIKKDAHWFVCDCLTHLSTGLTAKASAKATDVYAACDQAIARLEKQLRRYKRRLKDHHARRADTDAQAIETLSARAYVLEAQADDDELDGVDETVDASAAQPEEWRPAIVAETTEALPALSVGEAVMRMELSGADFFMFVNGSKKRLNVVYKRDDGAIGWIDPVLD